MAAIVDLPIRLKTPADYRAMTYNELLTQLNDLAHIQKYLPADLYNVHRAIIGSHMANLQRRAAVAVYEQQIDAAEAHIVELERALA